MEIVDTLGFLRGTWAIARSIEDHRTGTRGSFKGTATLTEVPIGCRVALEARAHYAEVGELHFGTHTGQARRTLEYRQLDDMTVMVYFANGRPFVDLDLSTGAWQSNHLCGDDRHEIATFVRSSNIVQERWRVQGPMTNYEAITIHTRMG
ncbi:MAG: DUF6314 family protein [Acidimicrobiales bacterium]